MKATVNVNGRITDERQAVVSVFDHGFLYGEGVYETLRTYDRRPFLFDRHMRRLRRSKTVMPVFACAAYQSGIRCPGLNASPNSAWPRKKWMKP